MATVIFINNVKDRVGTIKVKVDDLFATKKYEIKNIIQKEDLTGEMLFI